MDIENEIIKIIQDKSSTAMDQQQINSKTMLFDDLSISSINFVLIISDLEEAFNIVIDLEEISLSELTTIGALVELVKKFKTE